MKRRLFYSGLALCALIAARPVSADPITFTGNVAQDFGSGPGVTITPGLSNPLNIGQASWITNAGDISGYAIKNVYTSYNSANDTLYVGVNTFTNSHGVQAVAGDSYGTGVEGVTPSTAPPGTGIPGGSNPTLFGSTTPGSDKSITVAFASSNPTDPSQPGTPIFVAGIPADKTHNGPGTDGFNIASYVNNGGGIQNDFGATMTNNMGGLAFDPTQAHPGFEFSIANFSKIPGINPNAGFWLETYAGSALDVSVGETQLPFSLVPGPHPQEIPEPATVVAWTVIATGAAIRRLRRKARD